MRRSSTGSLAAITAIALALRVILVFTTAGYTPQSDATDFDRNALALAQGWHLPESVLTFHGGPTAFRGPAFPLMLSLIDRITGVADAHTRWQGGRLAEAVLGALAVLLIGLIARRLFSARVGLIAAGLAAIDPPLVLAGSSLLSESLFIPLVLAAVLSGLIARDAARRGGSSATVLGWCGLCGLLTAGAAMARSNGIVIVIALAWLVWVRHPRFSRRSLAPPAVVVLITALALVPWTLRNEHVLSSFVPTTTETGYALAGVYNPRVQDGQDPYAGFWELPVAQMRTILVADPRANEAQISSRLTSDALHYVGAHPFSLVRESYWNLKGLLNLAGTGLERWAASVLAYPPTLAVASIYSFWALGLLSLTAAVLLARGGSRRGGSAAFWAVPVLLLITTLPIGGDTRYRVPIDPFLLILAAAGLSEIGRRLACRSAGPAQRAASGAPLGSAR